MMLHDDIGEVLLLPALPVHAARDDLADQLHSRVAGQPADQVEGSYTYFPPIFSMRDDFESFYDFYVVVKEDDESMRCGFQILWLTRLKKDEEEEVADGRVI